MARAKRSESPPPKYVFPGLEDDPTLGGAIPAELFHQLQGAEPPPDDDSSD